MAAPRSVTLTSAVFDRLQERGIELSRRIGPAMVHPETSFEAPCMCHAHYQAAVPFRLGAFSGLVGGIAHASIGRYCSIATGVVIGPGDHPLDRLTTSWVGYVPEYRGWRQQVHGDRVAPVPPQPHRGHRPALIGNDVWIGAQVFIRGGIRIGDGAVIAAGSVVVKDVPPYAIIGGNPARVIRFRFPDAVIAQLIALQWWQYSYFELARYQRSDIRQSIALIQAACDEQALSPYRGEQIRLLEFAQSA